MDQHRFTRTHLAEQMERGEGLAVCRLRDTSSAAAPGDVVRQGSVLHVFVAEQPRDVVQRRRVGASGENDLGEMVPDFTVRIGGRTYYWEHCGMADDPAYRQRWEEVRRPWYVRNGFGDQLIETFEEPGAFDAEAIERDVVSNRLLNAPK